ncbi:CopG antitoxin of type II toxin-antitoxin system [Rubritalea squalenifaciens DSM 18772]|uniref:CopG antitoxin of type II toxin-antitoxin system n=2 Tax=Rubritalea TaxID=361050 RepID=A0A1M6NCT8_9BACT|nr:CopG family antitoxin [Rubritalea squalenifaciens]SHJ93532.1 CopG antitoxin of type II toxin-antitoxin system [Rubritalea squalenifaciens DSM 18772]
MNIITNWSDLPDFEDEQEEADFWDKHELDARLMIGSLHEPDSRESTTITLRFDPRMLSRIKRMARSRYLNYQSMMKQWLSERLEEEIRKTEQ